MTLTNELAEMIIITKLAIACGAAFWIISLICFSVNYYCGVCDSDEKLPSGQIFILGFIFSSSLILMPFLSFVFIK